MTKSISPRKSLIAFLISLCLPGLGQLYNGSLNKASWFFMAFILSSIVAVVAAALYIPPQWTSAVLLAAVFVSLLIWVYSVLEATVDAKQQVHYQLLSWQGGGVYLLVFSCFTFIALPLTLQHIKTHLVAAYRIPSGSMEPTLVAGDFIFADKRYNCPACKYEVGRGDIVTFTYPNNRNTHYIKRIIGLPGDRVQIQQERVEINGKIISKPLKKQGRLHFFEEADADSAQSWVVVWKQDEAQAGAERYDFLVPSGHVFVLGDNRNASNDSRFFDPVPLADIKGKARQIWMSFDSSGGFRMDRTGQLLR